jgi:TRAP-type C4-dicarboxylate transport system permease small subunit
MKRVDRIIEKSADLSGYFSGWMVPLMMILVVLEVFMRYVIQKPLLIADEFSAYLLVALSYLGLAYTWRQGGHVRITILVTHLSSRIACWVRFVGLILIFIFLVGLSQSGWKMILYARKMDLRSETFYTFPLFWPQLTVFVGFVLLTLQVLIDIIRAFIEIRAGQRAKERVP